MRLSAEKILNQNHPLGQQSCPVPLKGEHKEFLAAKKILGLEKGGGRKERSELDKLNRIFKKEWFSSSRLGKRQVLGKDKTKELTAKVYELWERKVVVPRIRHGKKQTVETLINEEALLLAKYLRNETQLWIPRVVNSKKMLTINKGIVLIDK